MLLSGFKVQKDGNKQKLVQQGNEMCLISNEKNSPYSKKVIYFGHVLADSVLRTDFCLLRSQTKRR